MRSVDVAVGLPLGLGGFYVLSRASAFWTSRAQPLDVLWSTLLTAVACGALGAVLAWRAAAAGIGSLLMLVLVIVGALAGSDIYTWALPYPMDFTVLLFHGSRSPLVLGPGHQPTDAEELAASAFLEPRRVAGLLSAETSCPAIGPPPCDYLCACPPLTVK